MANTTKVTTKSDFVLVSRTCCIHEFVKQQRRGDNVIIKCLTYDDLHGVLPVLLQLSRYCDSIRAGRCGDRIPVGARFSAPVHTGPEAYPASCTMGTGSFPRAKWPGCGADHPLPSKCRGHERVELYLYSPSGPS